MNDCKMGEVHFPSFLEGLSLRAMDVVDKVRNALISLPFWKGFH